MGVVPADQMSFRLRHLRLDPIPQAGHDVDGAVAVDRLAEPQRGIDDEIRDVGLGALAHVPDEEA